MKVTLLGSDCFSIYALKGLIRWQAMTRNTFTVITIDRHNNPIHGFCKDNNIDCQSIDLKKKFKSITANTISENNHYLIACSFGMMVPGEYLDKFNGRAFVFHPSILPLYRGCSPISAALSNGDKETEVSLVEMSKGKFDAGDILDCRKVSINPLWTYSDLRLKLGEITSEFIPESMININQLIDNKKPQGKAPVGQDQAPKLISLNAHLFPSQLTAKEFCNKFRGLSRSSIGNVYISDCNNRRLYIKEVDTYSNPSSNESLYMLNLDSGSIIPRANGNGLWLKCKDSEVLLIDYYLGSKGNLSSSQTTELLYRPIGSKKTLKALKLATSNISLPIFK